MFVFSFLASSLNSFDVEENFKTYLYLSKVGNFGIQVRLVITLFYERSFSTMKLRERSRMNVRNRSSMNVHYRSLSIRIVHYRSGSIMNDNERSFFLFLKI